MPLPVLVPLPLCHRCSLNVSFPSMNIREVNKWSCGFGGTFGFWMAITNCNVPAVVSEPEPASSGPVELDHLFPLTLGSAVHKHTHTRSHVHGESLILGLYRTFAVYIWSSLSWP